MIVRSIYLGYNNKKCFTLLMVKLYGKTLKALNKKISLRTRTLSPLHDVLNNMNSGQKAFNIAGNYIKAKQNAYKKPKKNSSDLIKDEYYYSQLMAILYNEIYKGNKIHLLRNLNDLLDSKSGECKYKYIIYVGYENNKDMKKNNFPTTISIFPFKSNFLFHRRSILGYIGLNKFVGHKIPNFKRVPDKKVFQLPFDRTDDIANFYKENNLFRLDVYDPIKFDTVFKTGTIKESYATKTFDRFNGSHTNSPLKLTKNNISVSFVKPNNPNIDDTNNIKHKVFKDDRLLNSMASFTGNGNSIVQQIDGMKLYNLLKHLKSAPNKEKCNFKSQNVPDIVKKSVKTRNGIILKMRIFVTYKSIPMFCSILRNKIVKQLLTGIVESPFCTPIKRH